MVDALTWQKLSVYLWRYEEARRDGLNELEARLFADSSLDIGDLRRLYDAGCPPGLIAKIIF